MVYFLSFLHNYRTLSPKEIVVIVCLCRFLWVKLWCLRKPTNF